MHHSDDNKIANSVLSITENELANYKELYWQKHHFSKDKSIENARFPLSSFEEEDNKLFTQEYLTFVNDILDIAATSKAANIEGECDLFYSISPLHFYTKEKIKKLFESNSLSYLVNNSVIEDIANQLNHHLRNGLLSKILVAELHSAKKAQLINGNSETERFKDYVLNLTASSEWIDYFFEEYPIAAYKVFIVINTFLDNLKELFCNLAIDKEAIQAQFCNGIDVSIKSVFLFVGDAHQKGKSVTILHLSDNTKIVYKPRAVAIDESLNLLLKYFNSIGFNFSYKNITSIIREQHSWVEYIPEKACETLAETEKYFTNMGNMLAVFYILGTKDIIADNIISHGEFPCFIDLELLINKPLPEDNIMNYPSNTLIYFLESVYSTGMLPNWIKSGGKSNDLFMGGINSISNQKVDQYVWNNKVTDEISEKKVRASLDYRVDSHLPTFNGKKYSVEHFYDSFLAGFTNTCKDFIAKKDIINLVDIMSLLPKVKNRVILRETVVYDVVKNEAYNPKYLSNKFAVRFLYDSLWASYTAKYITSKVITSEINQIIDEDIPFFYTFEGSTALYDGHNQLIDSNFFSTTSASYGIAARLKLFNEDVMNDQLRIIDGMVKIYFENNNIDFFDKGSYVKVAKDKFNSVALSNQREHLLRLSKSIALELLDKATVIEEEVSWITKNRFADNSNFSYAPIAPDLYEGSCGIALFFVYASRHFNDSRLIDYSVKVLNQSKTEFYYKLEKNTFDITLDRLRNQLSPSAYAFPTSGLFLMDHLSYICGSEYWDQQFAADVCDWIRKYLNSDTPVDLLNGLSGTIVLLLNVYRRLNDQAFLDLALECGDVIISKASIGPGGAMSWTFQDSSDPISPLKTLGGFAHGTAGIMYAFFQLSCFSSNQVYYNAALSSLKFDREQFDASINGWKDGRNDDNFDSAAWCHGSAGIGLSRLLASTIYSDATLLDEIQIAITNVLERGLNNSHCLCHGDLGNLEILTALLPLSLNKTVQTTILNYLNQYILQRNEGKEFRCGTGGDVELLGLFVGKAGIGYNLLRLADWKNTPSMLCLESPLLNEKNMHEAGLF